MSNESVSQVSVSPLPVPEVRKKRQVCVVCVNDELQTVGKAPTPVGAWWMYFVNFPSGKFYGIYPVTVNNKQLKGIVQLEDLRAVAEHMYPLAVAGKLTGQGIDISSGENKTMSLWIV